MDKKLTFYRYTRNIKDYNLNFRYLFRIKLQYSLHFCKTGTIFKMLFNILFSASLKNDMEKLIIKESISTVYRILISLLRIKLISINEHLVSLCFLMLRKKIHHRFPNVEKFQLDLFQENKGNE